MLTSHCVFPPVMSKLLMSVQFPVIFVFEKICLFFEKNRFGGDAVAQISGTIEREDSEQLCMIF